ncbi:putative beta-lysine N-acetyltransferase [Pelotomaculum sp. PtaB.Bin117]|uniref:putative beta-lysine N-acetyltransferase n=1 Tax=Pelotomaculum sp. PtaB.Bin117 TaxID=1811694 RepID=UPI0009CC1227|nr:putative beta-lysine N-acetyltransferase [Pelotomaculum sp. PtaB.Bin117]OPX87655.1 MAG: N-acetyltransferase YodP [Pelotomaculum sp. PtaB.Bin117]OPY61247.1 MAG: N-acetyltransferase YodP [Pelotomaculum sp. PtaU1.Bin065]
MADSLKAHEQVQPDQWEIIEGHYFKCHILISPYNRRITVYNFSLALDEGASAMVQTLSEKAAAQGFDKVWLKTGLKWAHSFLGAGVKLEAAIPGYFAGEKPALLFSGFLSEQRKIPSNSKNLDQIKKLVLARKDGGGQRPLPAGITLRWGQTGHCGALANLYSRVFATYPFPIFDSGYLKRTMRHNVCYITAWHGRELVAAAAAEMNPAEKNAEVTDFATAPGWRGHGLAGCLLNQLESRLLSDGIRCLYTIARSSSTGMNRVFANTGYEYCGVLIKNCNISGSFEDMNVWAKIIDG